MAEVTGLRNNALPYPIKNLPWGVVFPILDNTGALVSGASGLDSEVSLNGDAFVDCVNEATEIGSSGMYYLLLTTDDMAADVVTVVVKTSTTDAKTTPMVFYTRKSVIIASGTAAGGAAGSITLDSGASAVDDFYNGMVCLGFLDSTYEVRVIWDYNGSTKVASVSPNWNITPDSNDTFQILLLDGVQIQQANTTAIAGDATAATTFKSYLDGSEFMPVDGWAQEYAISGTSLTTKKPDGTTDTDYSPKTLATDPAAEPIISSS